ncbi:MAG: helix-turn-helix transcriptional regulator [Gemmataceae bacterium]|nr:helix-turn-helix transcriptional regulator [Gemmataceae bacterium]
MADRIHRDPKLSDEERARQKAVREKFQRERPSLRELVESEDAPPPVPLGVYVELRQALLNLKKAREAAGLSLADVAERSGMDKAALSRLENSVQDNPTVETLSRYAAAVGKKLTWTLQDLPAEPAASGG